MYNIYMTKWIKMGKINVTCTESIHVYFLNFFVELTYGDFDFAHPTTCLKHTNKECSKCTQILSKPSYRSRLIK